MLWSDFVTAVNDHMPIESVRRGLSTMRARQIRNAVLDLQRYIRAYRAPFKTTYTSADVTLTGVAQLAALPSGAKPKALYIYKVDDVDEPYNDECCRYRLEFYPWNRRQDLICGRLDYLTWWGCACGTGNCPPAPLTADELANWTAKAYVFTMAPMGRNFLFYPQVTDSTRLLLIYEGYLYDIDDADDVPFPEEASEAVAYYVLSRIAQTVDKDPASAAAYFQQYRDKRLSLFRDAQQEGIDDLSNDPKDQEYGATAVAPNT